MTIAPVRVDSSIIAFGLMLRCVQVIASQRTSRPSASVLMISMNVPDAACTTSPGLIVALALASAACRMRLRPILMTSFAFILGVVPLAIAHGAGAEMRRTLGIAVFSGMLGVTIFGVFLTPVFYFVLERLGTLIFGEPKAPAASASEAGSHH